MSLLFFEQHPTLEHHEQLKGLAFDRWDANFSSGFNVGNHARVAALLGYPKPGIQVRYFFQNFTFDSVVTTDPAVTNEMTFYRPPRRRSSPEEMPGEEKVAAGARSALVLRSRCSPSGAHAEDSFGGSLHIAAPRVASIPSGLQKYFMADGQSLLKLSASYGSAFNTGVSVEDLLVPFTTGRASLGFELKPQATFWGLLKSAQSTLFHRKEVTASLSISPKKKMPVDVGFMCPAVVGADILQLGLFARFGMKGLDDGSKLCAGGHLISGICWRAFVQKDSTVGVQFLIKPTKEDGSVRPGIGRYAPPLDAADAVDGSATSVGGYTFGLGYRVIGRTGQRLLSFTITNE